MHVDGARAAGVGESPHPVEQALTREDDADVLEQVGEQVAPAKVIVDKWSVDQAIDWEDKKIKEIYDTLRG